MTDSRAEVAIEVDGDELTPIEPQQGGKRITRRRLIWRRFLRNKTALVGAVIILLLIVIAVIGPYLTPYAYDEIDRRAYLEPPPRVVATCSRSPCAVSGSRC
jgi:peptide/nickel transport system permease protein